MKWIVQVNTLHITKINSSMNLPSHLWYHQWKHGPVCPDIWPNYRNNDTICMILGIYSFYTIYLHIQITVPPGETIQVQQLVGACGDVRVKTRNLRAVGSNKRTRRIATRSYTQNQWDTMEEVDDMNNVLRLCSWFKCGIILFSFSKQWNKEISSHMWMFSFLLIEAPCPHHIYRNNLLNMKLSWI